MADGMIADRTLGEHDPLCDVFFSQLSTYIDGEAPVDACAAIEHHLAQCPDCRALVATLRKTVQLAHELPLPVLTNAAKGRLLRALRLEHTV